MSAIRTHRRVPSVVPASLAAALGTAALGDAAVIDLAVGPASDAEVAIVVEAPFAGFLIGDYDEIANPGGTLTRPGLFGGSGNLPVDLEVTVEAGGNAATGIAGGVRLAGDPDSGTVLFGGLAADLLAGGPGSIPLTIELLYETFRSFQPDALFPGGIPLPIPFGELAVTTLRVEQLAAGPLTATPLKSGGFALSGTVPATLLAEIALPGGGGGGTPIPLPVALPVEGTLLVEGGLATATLAVAVEVTDEQAGPFEGVGFDALPLPLPTVLPPGGTANLLLTAELQSIASGFTFALDLDLAGTATAPGDVNGDGTVDFDDLLEVLAAWGPCAASAACPTDRTLDGVTGFDDLLLVLAGF